MAKSKRRKQTPEAGNRAKVNGDDFSRQLRALEVAVEKMRISFELEAKLTRPLVVPKAVDLKGRLATLEWKVETMKIYLEKEHRLPLSPESAAQRYGAKSPMHQLARLIDDNRNSMVARRLGKPLVG